MKNLPNVLLPIHNADKDFHEKWYSGRNMLNIPHPFRILCIGPPNSGKTTVVKNILLRAKPQFEDIVVIHCDAEYTNEYDDIDAELLSEIPAPEDWEGRVKTLVILDDLEYNGFNKIQRHNLSRLFGYVSTHKNVSCIFCAQDFCSSIPTIVRRCSNVFIFWRMIDMDSLATCSRKTGLNSRDLKSIFDKMMNDPRDSLWIDNTDHSPYKMRKNGFELLN